MVDFTFTLSAEDARRAIAEEVSPKKWIELFELNSEAYANWSVDIAIAEHFIEKLKPWFDKTLGDDIPDCLLPLLQESATKDLAEKNKRYTSSTAEDTPDPVELAAIELLRQYKVITYNDALHIFFEGYAFNTERQERDLSDFTTEELMAEIIGRAK